jgi:hypothetical protein
MFIAGAVTYIIIYRLLVRRFWTVSLVDVTEVILKKKDIVEERISLVSKPRMRINIVVSYRSN